MENINVASQMRCAGNGNDSMMKSSFSCRGDLDVFRSAAEIFFSDHVEPFLDRRMFSL